MMDFSDPTTSSSAQRQTLTEGFSNQPNVPHQCPTQEPQQNSSAFAVVSHQSNHETPLYEALVTIAGMTCGSCTSQVTKTLEEQPWVRSANVNLLNNCATVTVLGEENIDKICETIETAGYEAQLEQVTQKSQTSAAFPSHDGPIRATYCIEGMTSSPYSETITNALRQHEWVEDVHFNLVSHSATVTFRGLQHLNDVQKTIQNTGFQARLLETIDLKRQADSSVRTVLLRVEGIYCHGCASNIQAALKSFGHEITIGKAPSLNDPILNITYTPCAPNFTIRHIMDAISDADAAFNVSIYRPPTIEERARAIQAMERKYLLYRVILSFLTAIPTFIIGVVLMSLVDSGNPARKYFESQLHGVSRSQWALFAMATPVYFLAADVFHRKAMKEIYSLWRKGSPIPLGRRFYRFGSMNMLISFGTTIAYISSIAELAIAATHNDHGTRNMTSSRSFYFDSVVFLTMFLLIGRSIEGYSKAKSSDAVALLSRLRPTTALLVSNTGAQENIDVDLLEMGDTVRVPQGGSPPCDGVVKSAGDVCQFDESSLSGESRLVKKTIEDEVYAGTVNKGGVVDICVTKISGASMLDQIIQVVRDGQARRAPIERIADTLTSFFVPLVTLLAIICWITWLSLGETGILPADWLDVQAGSWPFWSLQFAIAVFVVACPCGIGLAAPTALYIGGGLAARYGILVKGGGEAFQEATNLDIVVFDKTGTLTHGGGCAVTDSEIIQEADLPMLEIIKALEGQSSHPIAKAIVSFCERSQLANGELSNVLEVSGCGLKGTYWSENREPTEIIIGNENFMIEMNIQLPHNATELLKDWTRQGKSIAISAFKLHSNAEWHVSWLFAIADPLRSEAASIMGAIQARGIAVWMLSGDNVHTALAVGTQVGIPADQIIAGVLPFQKADKIRYLQRSQSPRTSSSGNRERATVAMVGDGINDSPAMTAADVAIAIGSGSDIAISSAEFVLVNSSLNSLLTLLDLSRTVFRRIKFNFMWALVYNVIAVPVAAGCLFSIETSDGTHVRLDPVWASLAMACSSVSVVLSSLALRLEIPWVGFRKT
ncbi:MAG: hypothetical protein Q9227_006143 [Pyrenula ochraceoflavens]